MSSFPEALQAVGPRVAGGGPGGGLGQRGGLREAEWREGILPYISLYYIILYQTLIYITITQLLCDLLWYTIPYHNNSNDNNNTNDNTNNNSNDNNTNNIIIIIIIIITISIII